MKIPENYSFQQCMAMHLRRARERASEKTKEKKREHDGWDEWWEGENCGDGDEKQQKEKENNALLSTALQLLSNANNTFIATAKIRHIQMNISLVS